ncbi:MAG: glycosyltransferase family 39 protein [Ignavibacteriae bacterium]|nr:glycosyltransferase family 39 protein [Ignavibacteriota bacterium]
MGRLLQSNRDILFVALLSLVVRVLAIVPVHANGYTSDEREYIYMAGRLAAGDEFIDSNGERSTRAPLFPYVLSVTLRVFGNDLFIPYLVGCLFGTAVVILTFVLTMYIWGDRASALIASAATALYPGLVIYSSVLQTETLYIMFMLTALLFAVKMIESPTLVDAIVLAAASGLASLTRAVFLGFFPLLLLLIGWSRWREGKTGAGKLLAVAFAVWVLVLSPWTIRNYNIHGILIPVSSGSGNSLLTGNNPFATGTWRLEDGFGHWFQEKANERGIGNIADLSEIDRNSLSGEIALSYIASNPGHVLYLAVKKAYMFWIFPITNSDSNIPLQAVATGAEFVLYIGTVVGIVAAWNQRRRMIPIWGAALIFFMIQVVLHCESRFRLPLTPLICLSFGLGSSILLDRRRRGELLASQRNRVAIALLSTVVILAYGFAGWLFLRGII